MNQNPPNDGTPVPLEESTAVPESAGSQEPASIAVGDTIAVPHDPLADDEEEIVLGEEPVIPVEEPAPVEEAVTVEEPVSDKPQRTAPYYPTYMGLPDDLSELERHSTQPLPGENITTDQLMSAINENEDRYKRTKDTDERIALRQRNQLLWQLMRNIHGEGQFTKFFADRDYRLMQYLEAPSGRKLRISHPNIKVGASQEFISGEDALQFVSSVTRVGRPTMGILPHSGMYIMLDPFKEEELLDLNIELRREQITLGYNTRGAVFTGDDISMYGPITELLLNHVSKCTMKGFDRSTLAKYILVTDIPALMTAGLAAIYPTGYPILHDCTNVALKKCNYTMVSKKKPNGDYIPESLLDFTKTYWIDADQLTMEDIAQLDADMYSVKLEDIRSYQSRVTERLVGKVNKAIIWQDPNSLAKIEASFKVPTIAEYLSRSSEWVAKIRAGVEKALAGDDMSNATSRDYERRREDLIKAYTSIAEAAKHMAWVSYLEITDKQGNAPRINDAKSLVKTLENTVQIEGFKDNLEHAVQAFKEKSILAWTGIENFACPVCGESQTTAEDRTPSLIPINMSGYFFSTMVWRSQTIQGLD